MKTVLQDFSDERLLLRAQVLNRVIVTQDDDFLSIADQWQASGRDFPGLVFAMQQDRWIGKTIESLELIAHLMTESEMRAYRIRFRRIEPS